MPMILPWKKLSEKVEKVGWRTILHRVFAHPNGKEVECTIVADGEGVVVFALTDDLEVVLCRHFRPGPEQVMLDLPAGRIEEGEAPVETASRELAEETGYEGEIEYVGKFHFWAWGKGIRHVCVARNTKLSRPQELDEFEEIEVVTVPLDAFITHLRRGALVHVGEAYMALSHLGILKITPPAVERVA